MQSPSPFVNIAAYKFVSFDDTAEKRPQFQALCAELGLMGTILLSPGRHQPVPGRHRAGIDAFLHWLRADARFADIEVKESYSDEQPFKRMLVKLKREIITHEEPADQARTRPRAGSRRAPVLKRWLDQGHDDEGRPVVMMDTRNAFEVDVGTFDNTLDYRIDKFSEFPDVVAQQKERWRTRPW